MTFECFLTFTGLFFVGLAEIPAMSTVKSTLARFEQTISSNEASGSASNSFICNVVKDPVPRNRGTKKQLFRNTSEETLTSCLTEDQTVSSIEGANISHRESSDSFVIGMIAEVVEETKDGKDNSMSEATDKKVKMRAEDDRALTTMTWEEMERASMLPHKPQRNIGASVTLKDRMIAFNSSCSSMGGAMEDFEASMSSLNPMIPDVQTKDHVTADKSTQDTAEEKPLEVMVEKEGRKGDAENKSRNEVTLEKTNEEVAAIETKRITGGEATDKKVKMRAEDDRALTTMTWEEMERASMLPHKPQQNIGAFVTLKDRMNAFNASCSSMGGALEDFEASMSSLNPMIPDVQTKDHVTADNGTSTGYQQDIAEGNEEVEHQNNKAEASNEEIIIEKSDKPQMVITCDKPRRLSTSRNIKPMRKTGATMSLKARTSCNASCSSISYSDSYFAENYDSSRVWKVPVTKTEDENLNSKGEVQTTLKKSDIGNDDLEDFEASMSSLNTMIPDVQTKNQVITENGTNTGYQQDTAEEKPLEVMVEKEGRKGDAENKSRNKITLEKTNKEVAAIDTKRITGSEATDKKPKIWRDDDRALTTMSWEDLEKASMRAHKPQWNIGTSVSIKDRMNAFNASCSSMGGGSVDGL